ncbi:MAG: hypothetical protein AB4040_04805 [Synechococcus sp.]
MKVPNWKASGRLQEKGRKRHRRRQQKAKAFKALANRLKDFGDRRGLSVLKGQCHLG